MILKENIYTAIFLFLYLKNKMNGSMQCDYLTHSARCPKMITNIVFESNTEIYKD